MAALGARALVAEWFEMRRRVVASRLRLRGCLHVRAVARRFPPPPSPPSQSPPRRHLTPHIRISTLASASACPYGCGRARASRLMRAVALRERACDCMQLLMPPGSPFYLDRSRRVLSSRQNLPTDSHIARTHGANVLAQSMFRRCFDSTWHVSSLT